MSRRFATVRTIAEIRAIPNAERVELAYIDGWRAVIPKNTYKEGEHVLFIETDAALLNVDDPRFAFLRKSCLKQWKDSRVLFGECLRIRTIKLAGQISQGLVLKLADFDKELNNDRGLDAALNIVHFDELKENMEQKMGKVIAGDAAGPFPSFIQKTDEERIQNMPEVLEECKDMEFEVTLKLDGSSMSVGYAPSKRPDRPYFVCSRNLMLKDSGGVFTETAKKYKLEEKLADLYKKTGIELCLQGELIGPGINGNRGQQADYSFNVFRIWNISEDKWVSTAAWREFCRSYAIPSVPIISEATLTSLDCATVDDLVEYAKTAEFNGLRGEGFVFKSRNNAVHFKVINPLYLLEEK